jgi:hypothetical protein
MRSLALLSALALLGCDHPCPEAHQDFAVDGALTSTESKAFRDYRTSGDAALGLPITNERIVVTQKPDVQLFASSCPHVNTTACMTIPIGRAVVELARPQAIGGFRLEDLAAVACETTPCGLDAPIECNAIVQCVALSGSLVVDNFRPQCADSEQACGRFDARLAIDAAAPSAAPEVHGELTIAWHQSAVERTCHDSFGSFPMPMQ